MINIVYLISCFSMFGMHQNGLRVYETSTDASELLKDYIYEIRNSVQKSNHGLNSYLHLSFCRLPIPSDRCHSFHSSSNSLWLHDTAWVLLQDSMRLVSIPITSKSHCTIPNIASLSKTSWQNFQVENLLQFTTATNNGSTAQLTKQKESVIREVTWNPKHHLVPLQRPGQQCKCEKWKNTA